MCIVASQLSGHNAGTRYFLTPGSQRCWGRAVLVAQTHLALRRWENSFAKLASADVGMALQR